jgi:hypothetical protein
MTDFDGMPLDDLHSSGMLWYINRVAFHPHGLALAVTYDEAGVPSWSIGGDGSEIWRFDSVTDDTYFAMAMATLAEARGE